MGVGFLEVDGVDGDDQIGRLLVGDGGTGEVIEPFGEQAGRDARIVEQAVDALSSGPGVAVGAGNALGYGGDDGGLTSQDAAHGQGHDALQAPIREQVQQGGKKGGQAVLQFGYRQLVKHVTDQYTDHYHA